MSYLPTNHFFSINKTIEDMQNLGILVDSISGALYSPSDSVAGAAAGESGLGTLGASGGIGSPSVGAGGGYSKSVGNPIGGINDK